MGIGEKAFGYIILLFCKLIRCVGRSVRRARCSWSSCYNKVFAPCYSLKGQLKCNLIEAIKRRKNKASDYLVF